MGISFRSKNLKTITPDYMGFKTLSGDDRAMFPGQIIQYIVTPVLGIPMKWVTEITHVQDKNILLTNNALVPIHFGITNIFLKKFRVVLKWKIL